jgi:uncharacterized surface protein with fasciclin (FAS1) repeats
MPFAKTRLLNLGAGHVLNETGDLAGQLAPIAVAEAPMRLGALLMRALTRCLHHRRGFAAVGSMPSRANLGLLIDLPPYHALEASRLKMPPRRASKRPGGVIAGSNDPNGLLVGAFAGKARITTADVAASNGLVQVIDSGLLPYEAPAIVVPEAPEPPKPVLVSITDTIIALNTTGDRKGQFDTFLAAAQAADPIVLQKLGGADASTLFVPTDDACAALGLTPENVKAQDKLVLTDVLLYHIAVGKLLAADVLAAASIPMLKGGAVQQAEGVLTDNTGGQAKIVGQDIEASNGMIQVINAVLLPAKL